MKDLNIALLIDADNLSAGYLDNVLNELTRYGKVTIRRMYGDWSKPVLKQWLVQSSRYSLTPVMEENNVKGKNSSDIGLVIDAMDILYENKADCFCIASSDSDFTKLARRLRESGKMVIGMGERKTPEPFRVSCEKFIYLDAIEDEDDFLHLESEENLIIPKAISELELVAADENEDVIELFTDIETIETAVRRILSEDAAEGKETYLSEVGNRLGRIFPDFDVRNYGYSNLSSFVENFDGIIMENVEHQTVIKEKVSSEKDIIITLKAIYKDYGTNEMNIGELKKQLIFRMPNADISIKKSGVTKFSTFLEKKVDCISLQNDNNVAILNKKECY